MQRWDPALPWDDVRFFLALCRARTVGEAAGQLRVDASTVSRRLAALEDALGASLFERGRSGITKTKAAEDLMPVAEETEALVHRFARAADGLEHEVSGVVRVTCPPDVGEVVLVPLLPALRERHPDLQIVLDVGEAVRDLGRNEADLALRTVRPERGDLVVTRVARAEWVLATTPALARSLGPLRAWGDAPWVGWGERMAHVPAARWLERNAPDVAPVLRSDALALQIAAVRAGLGVALLPHPSVAHYGLEEVALSRKLLPARATLPADELYLVTHRALRDVPRVRAVWDAVTGALVNRSAGAPARAPLRRS